MADSNNNNEESEITDTEAGITSEDDIELEREGEQPKDTINRLRDDLKECVAKKQEYLSGWQRAKADLVNAKKEFDREREKIQKRGQEKIIEDLLPAFDSFEMAMADSESWEAVDEEWRIGVEQIYNQLIKALERNGVERIEPESGDQFDPQVHTSVERKEARKDGQDNTVASCEQVGYKLDDRIIRSADVVVFVSENEDNQED